MNQSNFSDPGNLKEAKLPRRDWFLLPLLGLLTICLISISTELIARWIFSDPFRGQDDCLVLNDPSTGVRGIPNSVCRQKFPEGQPVEYRFNSCGHRTTMDCGPKPAGKYRIVMTGTSSSMGLGIPLNETFGALLPVEISQRTGREVELYNESISLESPHSLALNFKDILAAKPDMILWIVSAWDVKNASLVLPRDEILDDETPRFLANPATESGGAGVSSANARFFSKVKFAMWSIVAWLTEHWHGTRADVMLNHFMYELDDQSLYLKHCNIWHDDAQYMGAEPGQIRLHHLSDFDTYAGEIEAQAKAANVPLVATFLPSRPRAALISSGEWPADIDPFSIDRELGSIITSHGGTFIDILPDYRAIPNPEEGYFPVNGHLNARGHATVSRILAKELTSGAVPALKAATLPPTAWEPGR